MTQNNAIIKTYQTYQQYPSMVQFLKNGVFCVVGLAFAALGEFSSAFDFRYALK